MFVPLIRRSDCPEEFFVFFGLVFYDFGYAFEEFQDAWRFEFVNYLEAFFVTFKDTGGDHK